MSGLNRPLVSVILPVYNAEKYLAAAVTSILNQTFTDFEMIVVDDCSTDDSFAILQGYAALDTRIKLVQNPTNCRLPATLNRAISLAKGKYLIRMDADDIALPQRFAKQVNFMETNPAIDISGTFFIEIDENGTKTRRVKRFLNHQQIKIAMSLINCAIAHPSVIMRSELFQVRQFAYSEQAVIEDYELWLRFIEEGVTFANLPEYLLLYRKSRGQITSKTAPSLDLRRKELLEKSFRQLAGSQFELKLFEEYSAVLFARKKTLKYLLMLPQIYRCLAKLKRFNAKSGAFNEADFSRVIASLMPHKQLMAKLTHQDYF